MRSFMGYLAMRNGRIAATLVIACGIVLGYFVGRTFVLPLTKTYPPDFGAAQWIEVANGGEAGYFRKNIYIAGSIKSAWLELASTGSYQLMVNNVQLDNVLFPGARPSGIYDITALLAPGQNVIALYLAGDSSIGARQIIARGAITVAGAPPQQFTTDSTWRATPAASSIPGGALWTAPAYDDSSWLHAKVVPQVDTALLQPLSVDPRLLTEWSHGQWITGSHGARGQTIFTYKFHSARRPRAAWLELSANGSYNILVNQQLAATVATTMEAELFGPNAPVVLTGNATRNSKLPVLITPRSGKLGSHVYSAISQQDLNQYTKNPQGSAESLGSGSVSIGSNTQYGLGPAGNSSAVVNNIGSTLPTGATQSGQGFSTSGSTPASSSTSISSFGATVPSSTAYSTSSGAGSGNDASFTYSGGHLPAGAEPSAPSSVAGATGGAAGSNSGSQKGQNTKYSGSLGATISLSPAVVMAIPNNPDTTPTAPPGMGDISPEPAPAAAQIFPLEMSPGDAPETALALTAYDISPYLKAGENQIIIRVHAGLGVPVLLADGITELSDGRIRRIATDGQWSVRIPSADGSVHEAAASVAGDFDSAPWGPPVWVAANPMWIPGQDTATAAKWILTILLLTAGVLGLWLGAGILLGTAIGPEPVWTFDAFLHAPLFLGTLALVLSTYDARFAYDWCFVPSIAWSLIGLLLASKLLLIAARRPVPADIPVTVDKPAFEWQFIALFVIVVIGFILRFDRFDKTYMAHDETAMVIAAWAIPQHGFPLIHAGSFTRYLATYELIPYPIAFFVALLGRCVTAYRLPSLIFSTLTIGLVGWIGRRMFDWRVGLLAALVWALLPIPINWAKDAFYPSQEAFFSALTFWCFWETIKAPGINAKFMRLTALFFILQYFSWEASGFVVITLFAALLVIKWGEWAEWVLDPSLWRCFGVVSVIVITQLCYREVTGAADYLGVMKDLSDICTPAIVPLDRLVFNPLYYLGILFFAENHIVITIVAMIGLPLVFRNKALLYLDVCVMVLYFNYTFFLDHYAPRYCYIWLSSLVLASSASFMAICDLVASVPLPCWNRPIKAISMSAALAILVLSSNQIVMKLFRLAPNPQIPVWYDRIGIPYKTNYHDPNMYIMNHVQPGDIIISMNPHMFFYDTGGIRQPDYCLNSLMALRMIYDGGQKPITYIDKWLGAPQLRSLAELQDVTNHAGRVWVVGTSLHDHSPAVARFISQNGRMVFESVKEQVWLMNAVPTGTARTPTQGSASTADARPEKSG